MTRSLPTRSLLRSFLGAAVLAASIASTPAVAQTSPVQVKDYDVFVDLPTAFAFIKLPAGWKFIGKLDAEQLRHLPSGTITSLLQDGESPTRLAVEKAHRASM